MLNLPLKGSTPVDTSGFVTSVTAGTGITMSGSATAPVVNVNQATAFAWTVAQAASVADAATVTMTDVWTVTHTSSATPGTNFGVSELYRAHINTNVTNDIGRVGFRWSAASAPVASEFVVQTRTAGASLANVMTVGVAAGAQFNTFVQALVGSGFRLSAFGTTSNSMILSIPSGGSFPTTLNMSGSGANVNGMSFTFSNFGAQTSTLASFLFQSMGKTGIAGETLCWDWDAATNAIDFIGGGATTTLYRVHLFRAPTYTAAAGGQTLTTSIIADVNTQLISTNVTATNVILFRLGSSSTLGPSAAATTYSALSVPAHTVTYTNTTGSTAACCVAALRLDQITVAQNTGSGTLTNTLAATLYIAGAPLDGTGTTITTKLALLVDAGASRFDGNMGFFGTAPVAQQTVGAVTNNVTVGGTDGTIADFTDLTVYANSAAAIRNDIYQLARSVVQLATAVRAFGLAA